MLSERQGKEMLLRPTETEPMNQVFKLAYLGSLENVDKEELRKADIEVSKVFQEKFKGIGLLNKYFPTGKVASR